MGRRGVEEGVQRDFKVQGGPEHPLPPCAGRPPRRSPPPPHLREEEALAPQRPVRRPAGLGNCRIYIRSRGARSGRAAGDCGPYRRRHPLERPVPGVSRQGTLFVEDFYRRRVELSARAGIRYWKVDWGAGNGVAGIRALGEGIPSVVAGRHPGGAFEVVGRVVRASQRHRSRRSNGCFEQVKRTL